MWSSFLLVAALAMLPSVGFADSTIVPVFTVCEALKGLSALKGSVVVVVGRNAATSEGSWLDQNCEEKLMTGEYEWSTSSSLAYVMNQTPSAPTLPKGFRWDNATLGRKLAEIKKTTSLRDADRWLAVYGRVETHFPIDSSIYPNIRTGNGGHPAGFGHLNGSPAQLVWPHDGILILH